MFVIWVASLALGVSAGWAQTQLQNPFANDPQAAEAGRGTFRIYCSPCHGIRAEGGRAPDLTRGVYIAGDKDSDLFRVISDGVAGTEMTDFSSRMESQHIWRLVSYIRSATRGDAGKPTGDPAAGQKLYQGKGGCAACHQIRGEGGRMGPDLSKAGRQRSLSYLRQSIIAPNDEITPGYATITVVTRDGKRITGTQRGFDNFSAQLMDVNENFHSFLRSEVASVSREFRSLMPSYGGTLSSAELDNLLAYLASMQ